MKILKKFLAATLAFAMAASVATTGFAMTASDSYKVKIDVSAPYVDGDATYVDASVYYGKVSGSDLVAFESYDGCSLNFKTKYNTTNATYVSYTTEYSDSASNMKVAHKSSSGTLNLTISNDGNSIAFDPTKAMFKIKFQINQTEAGSYSLWSSWTDISIVDDANTLLDWEDNLSVPTATDVKYTIAAAGGNEEVTASKTAGGEDVDYDTYTFENLEEGSALTGKKVLMQKAAVPTTGMTADTRFIVSNGTRTQIFGGDIWSRLGAEGDGVIDVANVIFGLIVPADNTDTFTFTVE